MPGSQPTIAAASVVLQDLGTRALGFFDRHVGRWRRAALDPADADQPRDPGEHYQDPEDDKEADPDALADVEEVVEEPGEGLEEVDQREDGEYAGGPGNRAALGERGDLLADLRLGELDLLADEQRGLRRDVAYDVAERLLSRAVLSHRRLRSPSAASRGRTRRRTRL